ncbi:MAG TPA: alpha/beta hydrolase-fold protein [Flavipsychrobacter sp.]|nr:alpha/beta hydrolase-fold protein [Flavipsychrobacter sp.]
MKKILLLIVLPVMTMACGERASRGQAQHKTDQGNTFPMYSEAVGDTFTVSVNLPNNYKKEDSAKYPVIYLLDANLYFDIVATTLNKYSDLGLTPSVILVGVGYKDFSAMDSLRTRDDTYPTAIPEYEMELSGGADKFLSFIDNELVPKIDKDYRTDTSKRVLMGHSLGGYFTTYAFLQHLSGKDNRFNSYIAASPSIHYNNYWMLDQLKAASDVEGNAKKVNLYITYGGLEDEESESDSSIMKLADLTNQLSNLVSIKQSRSVNYKTDIFSNLDHMDTQLPTFIKGLQWALNEEDK